MKREPCPFCDSLSLMMDEIGEEIEADSVYFIVCNGCGARGPVVDTPRAAVRGWNRQDKTP